MNRIRTHARNLRKQLYLSNHVPINFSSIRKILDFNLIFKPFARNSFSGIALKRNKYNFIIINSSKTLGHQNFTLGHELYHLYIQNNFTASVCNTGNFANNTDKEEKYADYFSINFLFPDEGIEKYIKNKSVLKNIDTIDLPEIIRLENIFGVSHHAALIKLKEMKLISTNRFNILKEKIINKCNELGYETSLYTPTNKNIIFSNYISLIEKAFIDEKISTGKYNELYYELGLKPPDKQKCDEDFELTNL